MPAMPWQRLRTRRVERQVEPSDPRQTFGTVADQFERAHVAALRPNSRQAYGSALARLRDAFGDRRMTSIGKLDVRAFVASETAEGLKPNTITTHLKALSAVFTFARDDLGIPVTAPKLKPSERPRAHGGREQRVLTDDELATVLAACPEHARLYFRTVVETGARTSEVLGLTTGQIGDDVIALAGDGTLAPHKTRQSRRTIEVTRGLAAELKLAAAPSGRVFDHLSLRRVDRAWAQALERAGLADPQPRLHDLRHSHVSSLIADGWDVVETGHRGHGRELLPPWPVDEVVQHWPQHCACGHAFSEAEGVAVGEPVRHQVEELPQISTIVIEHQRPARALSGLRAPTAGRAAARHRRQRVRPRLQAAIATLAIRNRISRRDSVELCPRPVRRAPVHRQRGSDPDPRRRRAGVHLAIRSPPINTKTRSCCDDRMNRREVLGRNGGT
jgi:integrase